MSTSHDVISDDRAARYMQVQKSEEFAQLRRKFRRFVFPMTAAFLTWYFAYVILAAFFPEFMSRKVVGLINVGLILGLLQFVSTFTITMVYARWADRTLDPTAARLAEHIERGELS